MGRRGGYRKVRSPRRGAGMGFKWPLGTAARPRRAVRDSARGVGLRAVDLRRAAIRPRLARSAFLEAAWGLRAVLGHQRRSVAKRGLATRTPVPSLPALRAARDTAVRAPPRGRAPLPAMLGVELREPILELQADRILGPSVRPRRVRHDTRAARRAAAGCAGPLGCPTSILESGAQIENQPNGRSNRVAHHE
jgi:hypothetical protein